MSSRKCTNVIRSKPKLHPRTVYVTIKPKEEHMSKFMVNLTAINPYDRQRSTPPIEVMVDNSDQRFVATIPTV